MNTNIKYIVSTFLLFQLSFFNCTSQSPTHFSTEALAEEFMSLKGDTTTLESILTQYKGKSILIDVWASWCKDCIEGIPKIKEIKKNHPNLITIFISMDRNKESWKNGIHKYNLKGNHFYMGERENSPFEEFLNINWIPRYLLINKEGEIVVFNAKSATNKKLNQYLKNI